MKARAIQAAILLGQSASTVQAAPLQYLTGAGDKATPVVALTWGVLLVSVIVVPLIGMLLAGAIWRRRSIVVESTALEKDEGGQNWLWIAGPVILTSLLLGLANPLKNARLRAILHQTTQKSVRDGLDRNYRPPLGLLDSCQ